ncbi:MAG: AbrB/MazE/SpoVT family DNA-binding domain-containing protein [Candidatus Eisenbacteria bacterium]|nr:AbrB/MazE/SpoVT family DNA-binding domain-containing protein [Candidatus Eisenbacteria bacterium]
MTKKLVLRRVGGSIGATLPKELADRFRLVPGDSVLAVETESGILLTPYDPTTERALAIAARATRRFRNALRELAK